MQKYISTLYKKKDPEDLKGSKLINAIVKPSDVGGTKKKTNLRDPSGDEFSFKKSLAASANG